MRTSDIAPDAILAVPQDYVLVWADEFDEGAMPHPSRWSFDTQYNRRGWHNEEQQYYAAARPRNARIENGRLVIEAHHERLERRRYTDWGGQQFTSARLITRGRAEWMYGFFEIRARLPCVRGAWPAIWLLPSRGEAGWRGGEIDIMEHVGHEPGLVRHSVHTKAANFRRGNHPTAASKVPTACSDFHLYQLHWTEDAIVMGVDEQVAFRLSKSQSNPWPFNRPFYLILNLAIGGSWGGAEGIDSASLPARMEVDFIRVYQQRRR